MSTSTTGASIVWKDAGGTKLVEIDIPNIAMSNIQDYVCGSSAPIEVDLNSAICVAQRPDAGAGPDGGQGCTTDAACVP
jgi:hypothetical protein